MRFLFRRESGAFITAGNIEYAYEYTCANCGYPLGIEDEACPRCMRKLEICPTCTYRTKRIGAPNSTISVKRCAVCDIERIPFGKKIDEIEGMYCSNIYGCGAGGMLLRNREFAVLRPEASLCSVCRHPTLLPLHVRTFRHVISACCFCNAIFGSVPNWTADAEKDWSHSLHKLVRVRQRREGACALCGRNDQEAAQGIRSLGVTCDRNIDDYPLALGGYYRVLELARALILYEDTAEVFRNLYSTWFSSELPPQNPESNVDDVKSSKPAETISVRRIMEVLLEGTLRPESFSALSQRTEEFGRRWEKSMPEGVNFGIPIAAPVESVPPKAGATGAGK